MIKPSADRYKNIDISDSKPVDSSKFRETTIHIAENNPEPSKHDYHIKPENLKSGNNGEELGGGKKQSASKVDTDKMSYDEYSKYLDTQYRLAEANKPDNFFTPISSLSKPLAPGEVQYGLDKGIDYTTLINQDAVNSKLFAAKEGWKGQFSKAVYKGLGKGVLGVGEFVGYLGDLDGMLSDTETVDNALSAKMREWKEGFDRYDSYGAPIHTRSDDPLDVGDSAFWANMLASTVESATEFSALGLGLEMTLGKALMKGLQLSNMAKVPAERLARVASALASNKAESTMMAVELKDNVAKDLIAKGYNPYDANQKGEEAASKFILANKTSAFLDYLQLGAMFGSIDAIGKVSKLTKATQYGVGAVEEATQEIYSDALQHGFEKQVTEDKGVLTGMLDFVGSKEAVVSGMGGIFGGAFNTGIGKAVEKSLKLYNPAEDPKYHGILTEKRPEDLENPGVFKPEQDIYHDATTDKTITRDKHEAGSKEYEAAKTAHEEQVKEYEDNKALQAKWDKAQQEYNRDVAKYEQQEGKLSTTDTERRMSEAAVRYTLLQQDIKNNEFDPRKLQKTFEGGLLDLVTRSYERQDLDTLVAKLEAYSDTTVDNKPAVNLEFKAAVDKLLPKIKKGGSIYNSYNENLRSYGKQAANDLLSIQHEKEWTQDEYKHASNELERLKSESIAYTNKDPLDAQNIELETELKALDIAINNIEKHYEEVGIDNDELMGDLAQMKKDINKQLVDKYRLTQSEAKILADNGEVGDANIKSKEAVNSYNKVSSGLRKAIENKIQAKVAAVVAEHYETSYTNPKTFEKKADKALSYVKALADKAETEDDIDNVFTKVIELSQVAWSKKHRTEGEKLIKQLNDKRVVIQEKEQQANENELAKIELKDKVKTVDNLIKHETLIDDLLDLEEIEELKKKQNAKTSSEETVVAPIVSTEPTVDEQLSELKQSIPAIAQVLAPLVENSPVIANKVENQTVEVSDIKLNDTDNEEVLEVLAADNIIKATDTEESTKTVLTAGPTENYNPAGIEEYTSSSVEDWLLNSNMEGYTFELKSLMNDPTTFKQGTKVKISVDLKTLQDEWDRLPTKRNNIPEAPNKTKIQTGERLQNRDARIDMFHVVADSFFNKKQGEKIKSLPFFLEINDSRFTEELSKQLSLAVSQTNSMGSNAHRMGLAVLWSVIVEQKPLELSVVDKSPGVLNWRTDTTNNPSEVFGDMTLYVQTELDYANDGINKEEGTPNKGGVKGVVYGKTQNARGDDYMVALNVGTIGEETARVIYKLFKSGLDNETLLDNSHEFGIEGITVGKLKNLLIHNGNHTNENNYKYPFYIKKEGNVIKLYGQNGAALNNIADFVKMIAKYPNPVELSFLNKSLPEGFIYNNMIYDDYNQFLYDTGRVTTTVSNDVYPRFYNSRVKLSSPDITAMNITIAEKKAKANAKEHVYDEIAKLMKLDSNDKNRVTMTEKTKCN